MNKLTCNKNFFIFPCSYSVLCFLNFKELLKKKKISFLNTVLKITAFWKNKSC